MTKIQDVNMQSVQFFTPTPVGLFSYSSENKHAGGKVAWLNTARIGYDTVLLCVGVFCSGIERHSNLAVFGEGRSIHFRMDGYRTVDAKFLLNKESYKFPVVSQSTSVRGTAGKTVVSYESPLLHGKTHCSDRDGKNYTYCLVPSYAETYDKAEIDVTDANFQLAWVLERAVYGGVSQVEIPMCSITKEVLMRRFHLISETDHNHGVRSYAVVADREQWEIAADFIYNHINRGGV